MITSIGVGSGRPGRNSWADAGPFRNIFELPNGSYTECKLHRTSNLLRTSIRPFQKMRATVRRNTSAMTLSQQMFPSIEVKPGEDIYGFSSSIFILSLNQFHHQDQRYLRSGNPSGNRQSLVGFGYLEWPAHRPILPTVERLLIIT